MLYDLGNYVSDCDVEQSLTTFKNSKQNNTLPPFYPTGLFLTRGVAGPAGFAVLITAAILHRGQPEWHKRLMLCTAVIIIVPGLERAMPVFLFGPHWYFVVDAVVIAIALNRPEIHLFSLRRIHPACI